MGEHSINRKDSYDERTSLLESHIPKHDQEFIDETPEKDLVKDSSWATSKRWQISYLAFIGCFFLYSLRVDLSVAIVCMCNGSDSNTNTSGNIAEHRAEFSWGESTKSTLLSAYFYGYLVLQVPGGWLAGKYGATRVISLTMALSALCTLLIPLAARNSLVAFYALRVLIGLVSGSITPAFQALWGRWAPAQERTKLAGFAYSGGYLGSIATFSVSGVLCDHGFDGGWPAIFYILGSLALLWTLLWYSVVYDSPSSHPTISAQEREYITTSLQDTSRRDLRIPWRGMFSSSAFWSLIVAIVGMAWVDYTFLTSLPQYLKDVLDFDISQDGFLSATPSVCQFVSSLLIGPLADHIRQRGVGTGVVRKIFQTITFVGIGVCLTAVGYVTHENRYLAVGLLGLSGFFAGIQQAGYVANFIDIAPRFAGVMYGVGNSIATVSGILSPVIVGAVTAGKSREEWQVVFFVCVGVSVLAAIVFVCFAQGHVQPWATETPSAPEHGHQNDDVIKSVELEGEESEENDYEGTENQWIRVLQD